MFRIDTTDATGSKPARTAYGTPGYYTSGTTITSEWLTAVQEEVVNAIIDAGLTLDKADDTQLSEAIGILSGNLGYMHVREEQSAGTSAGSFGSNNTFVTRVLNTEVTNTITGASLSSNQITLPAGTYRVQASAPTYQIDGSRAIIYDTTGSSVKAISQTDHGTTADVSVTRTNIVGSFTLAAESDIELRHIASSGGAGTNSLGTPADAAFSPALSINEVYSEVEIFKIA